MNNQTSRRFWEIAFGLLLILMGISAFGANGMVIAAIFMLLGFFLVGRQFDSSRKQMRTGAETQYEDRSTRQAHTEPVYSHALKAVERAGLNPDEVKVLPVDIGVMAFRGDQDPAVYRTRPVLDDVDYIQPFVQLRLPTKAMGKIRFEILDTDGQVLFIHEDMHQLVRGRNLITPTARLPIHDAQAMHGPWQLRVTADGLALATHTFEWQESTSKTIRRHLTDDGEIGSGLRVALAENRLQKMSLDELLAAQDDGAEQQQGRRS
jgi:hypothetical protein